jgi:hypothetical protein
VLTEGDCERLYVGSRTNRGGILFGDQEVDLVLIRNRRLGLLCVFDYSFRRPSVLWISAATAGRSGEVAAKSHDWEDDGKEIHFCTC